MTTHKMIEDVRQFHQTFGHPIQARPLIPSPERQALRSKLIRDEYLKEFDPAWSRLAQLKALQLQDLPVSGSSISDALAEFGDAIADVIYFLIGTALEYGLPLDQIWDAVQKANMSKLWTREELESSTLPNDWVSKAVLLDCNDNTRMFIVYDDTGKVRKPPSWKEPDIVGIIQQAMKG